MKILQSVQKHVVILGIDLVRKPFNRTILRTFSLYAVNSALTCVFLLHDTNDFREYIELIYMTTAAVMVTIYFAIAAFKMAKLFELFEMMEQIIDSRFEYDESMEMYNKTNRTIEKWTKIINFVMVKVIPVCWILPKVGASYFEYFTTDLGNDAFELPVAIWLPFDTKNPFVYLSIVVLQYIVAVHSFLLLASSLTIGIGGYFFLLSIAADIKCNLLLFNEYGKTQQKTQQMLYNQLFNTIQLHSDSKKLIEKSAEIYQPAFVTLFTWSLITISGAMLMIEMEIIRPEINPLLSVRISMACFPFGIVFIVCEFCQRISNAFEEINDIINDFDWYLYPDDLHKILPFILHCAQRPVDIEFFGSISCSRATFKRVIKSGYSYFTVLREFR